MERLNGQGVLLGIIDSGIDLLNMVFRKADGKTKVLGLWDQRLELPLVSPPQGYDRGAYFDEAMINQWILLGTVPWQSESGTVPGQDISGHGTKVAGIAAGENGAKDASLLIVALDSSFAQGLVEALDFTVKKAMELGMPLVINLSYGNVYGPHNGQSLLEIFMDELASLWKTVIVVGAGNEAFRGGHTSGIFVENEMFEVPFVISPYETVFNLQLWKQYFDEVDIEIITPGGKVIGPIIKVFGVQRYPIDDGELLLFYGEPNPFSMLQEIYFDFIPKTSYILDGLWHIRIYPKKVIDGTFHLWMPSGSVLNTQTRFLYPTPDTTLTMPSSSKRVITVGAYDAYKDTYADFSGRGPLSFLYGQKPDVAAPGVDVWTTTVGGGSVRVTGTSFAAPYVSAICAKFMQQGIVMGEDPFMYGEKVKAYLIRQARPLNAFKEYPNVYIGYGVL